MHNRVRVRSDQNVVTAATVELWDGDSWVDVSHCVRNIRPILNVGEVSRVSLDLITADVDVEGLRLDEDTLSVFATCLRDHGYTVAPVEVAT